MTPASTEHFATELTACLALVAPVGMTEESRREWLAVAWRTLQFLPADLLSIGCSEARKTCDHPAKLVPVIVAATSESMATRRRIAYEYGPRSAVPKLDSPPRCTPEEAREIVRRYVPGALRA